MGSHHFKESIATGAKTLKVFRLAPIYLLRAIGVLPLFLTLPPPPLYRGGICRPVFLERTSFRQISTLPKRVIFTEYAGEIRSPEIVRLALK